MGLLGWPLLVLSVVLAVAAPVATALVLGRTRRRSTTGLAARLAMILVSQLAAVLAVAVAVNDHFQFFASWSDLFGSDDNLGGSVQQAGPVGAAPGPARRQPPPVRFAFSRGDDAYVALLKGPRSKIRNRVYVWLPPQYHDPAYAGTRFPVLELLPGYPGTPNTWFHAMAGIQRLETEIAAGRARPFILAAAAINVWPDHDTECTDIPGGPKVATWLVRDVRDTIVRTFRAEPDRAGWALMGYSTGGFCAAKLAMQYPRLYRAAVSMAGYFSPTSPLLTRSRWLSERNNPLYLVRHRPRLGVALLLAASRQDPGSVGQVQAMVAAARPPIRVFTYIVALGGHNTKVWSAMLPTAYDWLSRQLGGPASQQA